MRRKQKLFLIMSLTLVVVTGVGSVFAAWNSEIKSKNIISTGSVRGQIVEDYQQGSVVYPGGTVEKSVNVMNTGSVDMLARIKIKTSLNLETTSQISNDIQIDFDTTDWYFDQESGYYYYKNVLAPGATTVQPLFSSFGINKDLDQSYANAEGTIQVLMECVQAGGNGIGFWNKTLNELGISYTEIVNAPIEVGVAFEGANKGFVFDKNKDDLFANFKDLVPGETCNQTIKLQNNSNDTETIFLRAEATEQDAEGQELVFVREMLEKYAIVRVTNQAGELLYDGPASGKLDDGRTAPLSMKKQISLGSFATNKSQNLSVELYLEPEMGNQYQSLLGKVTWVFSANGADTQVTPPKTGDESNTQVWLVGFALSTTFLLICCISNRKKRQNDTNVVNLKTK